jgi:flagellar basal body rod protein FlgG
MIRMIETMRRYEFSQRILQGYDGVLDRAFRTLGEF